MASIINHQIVSSVVAAAADIPAPMNVHQQPDPQAIRTDPVTAHADSDVVMLPSVPSSIETNGSPCLMVEAIDGLKINTPNTSLDSAARVSNDSNKLSDQLVPVAVDQSGRASVKNSTHHGNPRISASYQRNSTPPTSNRPSSFPAAHMSSVTSPHQPPNPTPTRPPKDRLSASLAASLLSSSNQRRALHQPKNSPTPRVKSFPPNTSTAQVRGARPSVIYPGAKAAQDTLARKGLASEKEILRIVNGLKLPQEKVYSSDSDDEAVTAESENSQIFDENADLKRRLRDAYAEMEHLNALHSDMIAAYETQASELRAEVCVKRKELARLEVAERTRAEADDEWRQMVIDIKAESDMYKKRCSHLRQEVELKSEEIKMANSHLSEARIELQVARNSISRLTAQRDSDLLGSTRLIERMQRDHDEAIQLLESENVRLVEQLRQQRFSDCGPQPILSRIAESPPPGAAALWDTEAIFHDEDGFDYGDVGDVDIPTGAGLKSLESELADCTIPEVPEDTAFCDLPVLDALSLSHAAILSGCLVGRAPQVEQIYRNASHNLQDRRPECLSSSSHRPCVSPDTSPRRRHSDQHTQMCSESFDSCNSSHTVVNNDFGEQCTETNLLSGSSLLTPVLTRQTEKGRHDFVRCRSTNVDADREPDRLAPEFAHKSGKPAVVGGGARSPSSRRKEGEALWAAMHEFGTNTNPRRNNLSSGNDPVGHNDLRVIDDIVDGWEDRVRLKFLMRSALWRLQDEVGEERARRIAVESENRRLRDALGSPGSRLSSIVSAEVAAREGLFVDRMLREVYG